ncbi:DUF1622 domain-containing protein [Streptomyces sp. NPDC006971]|uniref:DUF1622 domain-containing protein n=1 Tax=Streptomyces sp. NPDC006971 TaxID=3154784 RepID=UPI0033F82671
MFYRDLVEVLGTVAEGIGVAVIAVGSFAALVPYLVGTVRRGNSLDDYQLVRQRLGRTILLGLEFLVAGDIIRSVAVSPTFAGIGVLALIVLIRTFLSTALIVEIEGRWPWRSHDRRAVAGGKPGQEAAPPVLRTSGRTSGEHPVIPPDRRVGATRPAGRTRNSVEDFASAGAGFVFPSRIPRPEFGRRESVRRARGWRRDAHRCPSKGPSGNP